MRPHVVTPVETPSDNEHAVARIVFVISLGVTAALYAFPNPVAYPLLLLSTLVHEMGHGVAALCVGAEFHSFVMYQDASGLADIRGRASNVGSAVISAGGLVGPAFAAAVSFLMGRRPGSARLFLGLLCVLCLLALVLVVRNLFGWAFVGGFALILALLVMKAGARLCQVALVFLGTQLGLSVFSRGDYLFTDVARTSEGLLPSDVANMSSALFLPYWFWGAACGAISVFALMLGALVLWKKF